MTGVDERQRAETLLAGEKRLLEMVATGDALTPILEALCRLVDDTAAGSRCSVLLVDPGGHAVRHAAAPGLPQRLCQAIDGQSTATPYWGPCAMAVAQESQVIVTDIAADERWNRTEWADMTLSHGLRACWTTPIPSRTGGPLGTFALYRAELGSPTPLELSLIDQFTHVASIAIERDRRETALRRSETFLAEAQRLSLTGSFAWRTATDEIEWSEQTYRIYELDPSRPVSFELVGSRIHPEEAAWFQQLLLRARDEGRDLDFEHRLLMPDGSIKYLHVVAHATRDPRGQLEFVGAVQDVTERRRSDDALSRTRSELAHMARVTALGALTASIAHEVNQPLSGIVTNASTSLRMLADDPPNVDGARETARRTIRDAHRAADVIARLRALFKKAESTIETVDLNEAAREVIALSFRELQRERIRVRTELADGLPTITGDRVQLQQVILNLILNAAEAMSATDEGHRELVVRTEPDGDGHVRLSVQDTGPGFDAQQAKRLFDPFYTSKRDGMGVGLSISRSIIDNHQGRIWADSEPGKGALVSFAVPRVFTPIRRQRTDDPPPPDGSSPTGAS